MLYRDLRQGIHCQTIEDEFRSAASRTKEWEGRASRMQEKIGTLSRQLKNLHSQVKRTGDAEGFAQEIEVTEDEISDLQKKLVQAKNQAKVFREMMDRALRDLSQNGCR